MKQVLLPALAAGLLLGVVALDVHGAAVPGQGTWKSTLKARDLDGDSSTGEAYYDTTLDITWLADANAGIGSPYDTLSPGSGIRDHDVEPG